MSPDAVVAACRAAGVRLIRFLWCDNGGVVRGKAVHVDQLADRMRTGVGLTLAMQAMNSLDQLQPVDGMGPVGEVRLVPDPESFRVLPYAPASGAMLVDHVAHDHQPYAAGPRAFLRRMTDRLAERDLVWVAAVENEFSLAVETEDGHAPIDTSLCFATQGFTAAAAVVDAIVEALEAQGIALSQYYPELGHGQHELSVEHRPAVAAADTQVLVRETIRGVAAQFDLVASLSPKPWSVAAGNGGHIHFSVWDGEGRNRFHDPQGRFGLSRLGEQFVAGILDHTPALLALTAPSYLSYARLQPRSWASAYRTWGPDNREATVRVPSLFWGEEEASANLEFKPTDATCNPYLAFGGLIAAGLDGIERQLEPPEPVGVDPADLTAAERSVIGADRYPTDLGGALDALEADPLLMAELGPLLATSYVAVRRSEFTAYSEADDELRYGGHFAKY